ncbi:hypothetical protein JCM21142_104111 [Saccharicrinis fermentans DSM 9555 = JCM 21142]|uniref:Uncharacterized protein n=1 Tax=Saccharicrinis fermentans DSM 9555 = JCM 21142 TaxID=869213 RepID=W7YSE3_9BACT|nr:hypothetical protein JCM21142_104111 [Saccharicrinis fermentans DSM 9555 = JCM 21142]
MQYDPIKKSLGKVFNQAPFLRIFFYKLLDLLLLRSWHIRKEIRKWSKKVASDIRVWMLVLDLVSMCIICPQKIKDGILQVLM